MSKMNPIELELTHRIAFEKFLQTYTNSYPQSLMVTSERYSKIVCYLQNLIDKPEKNFKKYIKKQNYNLQQIDGVDKLYREVKTKKNEIENLQVAVIDDFFDILYLLHVEDHARVNEMDSRVSESYYGIPKNVIANFVHTCPVCHPPKDLKQDEDETCEKIIDRIKVNFINMKKKSTKKQSQTYDWIVNVIETSSSYRILFGLEDLGQDRIAQGLARHVFSYFGIPRIIEIQNNKDLCDSALKKLISNWNVKCKIVITNFKSDDILVENMLNLLMDKSKTREWIECLPELMYNMNNYQNLGVMINQRSSKTSVSIQDKSSSDETFSDYGSEMDDLFTQTSSKRSRAQSPSQNTSKKIRH